LCRRHRIKVVVHRQDHHERQEQADCRQEVPNIMRIIKLQKDAFAIAFARLRGRFRPICKLLKEKEQTETPNDRRQNYINNRPRLQFFFIPDLHCNVVKDVIQQICDENGKHKRREIFWQLPKPQNYERDIHAIANDQEYKSCWIFWHKVTSV